MKKLLILLLATALLLGQISAVALSGGTGTTPTLEAPETSQIPDAPTAQVSTTANNQEFLLFFDDFSADSTSLSRGWNVDNPSIDGKLYANQNNFIFGVRNAITWQNYRVEADVLIDETSSYSSASTSVSGIIGRRTQESKNGYEFGIFIPTPNSNPTNHPYSLRLYDRGNAKTLATVPFSQYQSNTTYHLAMEFKGDTVYCYVDGTLYITAQISADKKGAPGVHVGRYCTYFDNFKVTALADFDLGESEADGPAAPTGSTYVDNFEDEQVSVQPSHWVETQTTTTATITPVYGSVLFADDFSADSTLVSRGWAMETTQANGMQCSYQNNLVSGNAAVQNLRNFRVEVDLTIDESTTHTSSATSPSGLLGRRTAAGKDGYEFALLIPTPNDTRNQKPALRLYDRKNGTILASATFTEYTSGATYHLAMEFINNFIFCYVDGTLCFSVPVSEAPVGMAGVHAQSFPTYFDNFKITEITDYTTKSTIQNFQTADQNGNRVLRGSSGGYAVTWLHIYEANPQIQADLSFSALPTTGKAGILGRYSVENSFVQGGYDFAEQKWFIASREGVEYTASTIYSETVALSANTPYTLKLYIVDALAYLYVNNQLTLVSGVSQTAYGRVGLFVDNATADFDNVSCIFPSGTEVTPDVVAWTFYKDAYKHYCEIDVLGNEVLAFGSGGVMYSNDYGKTFANGSGDYSVDASAYTSTIEVEPGKYLRILTNPMLAQVSTDMINWTTTAEIVPVEECKDENSGQWKTIIHVSSLTKIRLPDGKTRIFIPIGFRKFHGSNIVGHATRVFYSDDGGYTWTESENDTTEIPGHDEPVGNTGMTLGSSFCEAKVIACADGTLRMYSTRNWATCVYYVESTDYGVTWSSWGTIPEMPCAISSFGVCEDPTAPGTWYMVYVKDVPTSVNDILPRTHLVLAKTTDGKNWTEVMTLDRVSNALGASTRTYQFLDPSITVTEGYFYIGYGRSDETGGGSPHYAQRQRYLRIGRAHTHDYDNACDTDCSICGEERAVGDHVYSDEQDADCNECGHIREITPTYIVGDLNGDNEVSDADAVYLLMHTFFADFYPVNQDCDFNGDTVVSDADATYLLMHTFFPDFYPLD